MQILNTDLWSHIDDGPDTAIVITTNGTIKSKTGEAVMGKGCAGQAAERWPELPILLGTAITMHGNRPFLFNTLIRSGTCLITFPTKPISEYVRVGDETKRVCTHLQKRFKYPGEVPGWAVRSQPELIEASLTLLLSRIDDWKVKHIHMPLPGAGSGEVPEEKALLLLSRIKDDNRFYIHMRKR